ncbi:hypothetical protein Goshw_023338 [Gossypium schwendimanii]|uniref:Uncharacterized protein n=1 Tax=Gossypium schwendimanii TaxID=34291 RepID=A0A7J9MDW0_GOSSC|nr:hypothetical protein [Gossypium schwendimanii]
MNFLGIAIIVYSLWLQKKWNTGVAQLVSFPSIPNPWFIYTCFGVGIAVCLSSLFSFIASNCISTSILCIVSFALASDFSLFLVIIISQIYDFGPSTIRKLMFSPYKLYIFSVCSLLFLEIAVIVTIFFKNDWSSVRLL